LESGCTREDFSVKLLLIGEPEYVSNIESQLAKDSLWPNGLNGNAGKNIIRTREGQKKVSDAVSKAKKGMTKDKCAGVRTQIQKLKKLCGDNRTESQKVWDAQKSEYNKSIGKAPPQLARGSKKMNN
jgi:hypothetical protein